MNTYLFDIWFNDNSTNYIYVTAPNQMTAYAYLQNMLEDLWDEVTGVKLVEEE